MLIGLIEMPTGLDQLGQSLFEELPGLVEFHQNLRVRVEVSDLFTNHLASVPVSLISGMFSGNPGPVNSTQKPQSGDANFSD